MTPPTLRREGATRLRFVWGAVIVLVAVGIGSTIVWPSWRASERGPDRPNIVLIVADDQRWDTLAAMPAVRRLLMRSGVTFRNAFTTTPSCCPARVSLLTGDYSHTSGVLDGSAENAPGGAPAFEDGRSLATWLDDAGYRTGLVGKYLNDYGELPAGYVPPGWDEWFALADPAPQIRYYDYTLNENGKVVQYGDNPADYTTRVLERKAVEFVEGSDGPFFLYLAPIAPHPPAEPDPSDLEAPVAPWTPPPSFDELDVSDKPGREPPHVDRVQIASTRERMLRSLRGIDRAVAAISTAIDAAGRSDETYFIYTSDNGFLWGEHRRTGKVWPYEESIRVPLVIRPPGRNPTRIVDGLVLNIDVAPTVADLASVEMEPPVEGRSLVPFLSGAGSDTRDRFVIEFLGYAPGIPPYVGLRTDRYVYVEYRGGGRELYDLHTDRYQLTNLLAISGSPGSEAIARSLRRDLRQMTAGVELT